MHWGCYATPTSLVTGGFDRERGEASAGGHHRPRGLLACVIPVDVHHLHLHAIYVSRNRNVGRVGRRNV